MGSFLSAALLAAVATASSAADYPVVANLRYARHAETVLDLLQPRDPALKNRPGVVMIHGFGGTQSKTDMLAFCTPFLDRGMVVANLDYRLGPDVPEGAALSDVLSAVAWLRDSAAEYKVDPKRILLAGFGEGGTLALLAGLSQGSNAAAILDFAGPLKIASVRKDAPPVLIVHGDADESVAFEQSAALQKALKQAGDKSELIPVPGGKHALDAAQLAQVWPQIFKWLKKLKLEN